MSRDRYFNGRMMYGGPPVPEERRQKSKKEFADRIGLAVLINDLPEDQKAIARVQVEAAHKRAFDLCGYTDGLARIKREESFARDGSNAEQVLKIDGQEVWRGGWYRNEYESETKLEWRETPFILPQPKPKQ